MGTRRRYTTTAEQDKLIAAEASSLKLTEQAVFRSVVEAGFATRFPTETDDAVESIRSDIDELADEISDAKGEALAYGKATLAWASWASYAAFDMLRAAIALLGADPDDERIASAAMSRFMSDIDCSVPAGIWESAGRRMAAGKSYHDALVAACVEHGVSWEEFSGSSPEPETRTEHRNGKGEGRKTGGKRKRKKR